MGPYSQRVFLEPLPPFLQNSSITIFTLLPYIMQDYLLSQKRVINTILLYRYLYLCLVSSTLLIDIYSFSQVDIELKNGIIFYSYIIFIFSLYTVWYRTVYFSIEDSKRKALPGLYSKAHKRAGNILMVLIGINPILGMITYYLSFII